MARKKAKFEFPLVIPELSDEMKEELRKDSERLEKEMKEFEEGADWTSVTIKKSHCTTAFKLSKHGYEETPCDSYQYSVEYEQVNGDKKVKTNCGSSIVLKMFAETIYEFLTKTLKELDSMQSDSFNYHMEQMFKGE